MNRRAGFLILPILLLAPRAKAENDAFEMSELRGAFSPDAENSGGAPVPFEEPLDEKEYVVGPGDEFQIYVGKNYNLKVNPESYLTFPGLEPIPLSQVTLAEAKRKIRDALGKSFKKDLIFINIRQLKVIKVAVLGEVGKPGIYPFSCNTRLSEVLVKADGYTRTARVPLVQVLRKDGTTLEYNLGEYYRLGAVSQNPYLRMGDRVFVPRVDFAKPRIEILFGSNSYLYQLGSPKNLGEIISEMSSFARGFDMRVARVNSTRLLRGEELLEYRPADGDTIALLGKELRVFVEGEVGKPLVYGFIPGNSVRDYIAEAGLSGGSQHKGYVRVVRANGKEDRLTLASTEIYPGDHIYVSWSGYTRFKEYLLVTSSIATVVLSTLYLIQVTKGL